MKIAKGTAMRVLFSALLMTSLAQLARYDGRFKFTVEVARTYQKG
jgi:hypothetical protein